MAADAKHKYILACPQGGKPVEVSPTRLGPESQAVRRPESTMTLPFDPSQHRSTTPEASFSTALKRG
jgi:hypothetical protein